MDWLVNFVKSEIELIHIILLPEFCLRVKSAVKLSQLS